MKLTNLIPIKAGKTLSRLCIIGALSLGSSFVFAQNQQVRLSGNNLTLKAAFKQIEQQTKLFVDYNTQDVNDSRVIKKVPVGDNVKNVLEQLLEGMNCSVTFSNGHVIISRKAPASSETKKVTGIVKDEYGNEFACFSKSFGTDIGITVCGNFINDKEFRMEYYYP